VDETSEVRGRYCEALRRNLYCAKTWQRAGEGNSKQCSKHVPSSNILIFQARKHFSEIAEAQTKISLRMLEGGHKTSAWTWGVF
jgi:hypothetical protein